MELVAEVVIVVQMRVFAILFMAKAVTESVWKKGFHLTAAQSYNLTAGLPEAPPVSKDVPVPMTIRLVMRIGVVTNFL